MVQNELVPIKQARILSRFVQHVYLFDPLGILSLVIYIYVLANKILIYLNVRQQLWMNACITLVLNCFCNVHFRIQEELQWPKKDGGS